MLTKYLQHAGINRADAELLLGFILQKPRTWILAHPEAEISATALQEFESLSGRRKNHEPIAYILREKEFYGRKFFVDKRVLIPRPATETLIDEVKRVWRFDWAQRDTQPETRTTPADSEIVIFSYLKEKISSSTVSCQLLDVGTGSGCIGITLALELPEAKILCTDISDDALDVAKENAARHKVSDRITFEKANLHTFTPSHLHTPFLLVSNPPYIPSDSPLPPDVLNFEPKEALFAGPEGMDVLEPLVKAALHDENCLGFVLECREEQAKKLSPLL